MNKLKINFHLESLDGEAHYNVIGELKKNRIIFVDPEKNTNYIILKKDIVEYYKKGNVDMNFKFATDKYTKGYYTVSSLQMDFEIKTLELTRKDGFLAIKYELYDNDDIVNEATLKVKYSTVEEE
jgi:uncharacterized beta-barrel protein YwiB (DUF1934 family)